MDTRGASGRARGGTGRSPCRLGTTPCKAQRRWRRINRAPFVSRRGFQFRSATRTITISTGTALFFPLLNSYDDTTGGYPPADPLGIILRTPDSVRAKWMMSADIDGNPVQNIQQYWIDTSVFFEHLPMNNPLLEELCTTIACSCGYYLMVDDISRRRPYNSLPCRQRRRVRLGHDVQGNGTINFAVKILPVKIIGEKKQSYFIIIIRLHQ